MTKSLSFKPSPASEGTWFCHEDVKPVKEVNPTSTGEMLETPFHPSIAFKSPKSPLYFQPKTALNFKSSNVFSEHDNKRAFNTDSEYFSYLHNTRTLGRRQFTPEKTLHYTDATFLHHQMDFPTQPTFNPPSMDTTYRISYYGGKNPCDSEMYRRFPKVYSAGKSGPLDPTMCANHWFKEPEAYKASNQTLVGTLSPYIKNNPWKYSYQGSPKVYPN